MANTSNPYLRTLILCVVALSFWACLPKRGYHHEEYQAEPQPQPTQEEPAETLSADANMEPPPLAPLAIWPPESALITELNEQSEEPDHEESFEGAEGESIAPSLLLETALQIYGEAQALREANRTEDALKKFDQAFEHLLQISEEADPAVLTEKENLRYLIAKRLVELYASQRVAVGDLTKSIPMEINAYVEREIKSFQKGERRFFLESYIRSGRYHDYILAKLREEGLPDQLGWLPLIESGFKTHALSRARALGLWQFITSTGYRYGLSRDQWVDERMDPEKATRAAISYLSELHSLFGDWLTALAAYNCGEGRVLRTIKRQKINYLDNFWDLYEKLPRETARYVPRFLAVLAIIENYHNRSSTVSSNCGHAKRFTCPVIAL